MMRTNVAILLIIKWIFARFMCFDVYKIEFMPCMECYITEYYGKKEGAEVLIIGKICVNLHPCSG